MATPPPGDSLRQFMDLAQSLRNASINKDFVGLGRLAGQNLNREFTDMMIHVTSPLGSLTLVGSLATFWSPLMPSTISREPSLEEMALMLQAARRGVR